MAEYNAHIMDKPVTLQDIADRCEVSKVTVSRTLRGQTGKVSAQVAAHIAVVAKELGYDPAANHIARRLSLQKQGLRALNHLIAIFFPLDLFAHDYYVRILRGLIEVLQAEQFGLLMHYSNPLGVQEGLLPLFARGDVDAALVLANPHNFRRTLDHLRAQPQFGSRPIVSLINPHDGTAAVVTDDRNGAYLAVQHLLALGHRHLLHFCDDLTGSTHLQRYMGYLQAYAEAELNPDRYLHVSAWDMGDFQRAQSQLLLNEALSRYPEVTGILARNDQGAIWIAEFLAERGLRVPEDYSVIGFDDTDQLLNARNENILTTVQLPLHEVGREAARLVIRQLYGRTTADQLISLPVALMVRGTTAPPRERLLIRL